MKSAAVTVSKTGMNQLRVPILFGILAVSCSSAWAQSDNAQRATVPTGPTTVQGRLEEFERSRRGEFDFPGIDRALEPWFDWKSGLAERGVRLGFDYNFNAQGANNSVGEDSAVGGVFRAYLSWDIWGRGDPGRTGSLDFRIESRHRIGTPLAPEELAPNFGWIGTSAPDWSNQGWGVPVLKLRQRLDVGDTPIEINIGRMSAFGQFDITPYSDNLTTFQSNSIILNPTIAYPSAGAFGVSAYVGVPRSNFYALGMVMDPEGVYDDFTFTNIGADKLFKALEFGWTDQSVSDASFLFNNVHVALWHTDSDNHGAALTGSYTFAHSRIGTFGRLAWANEKAGSPYQKYAAAGITKGLFRDSLAGLGTSWGRPSGLDTDQIAVEAFYRWQIAQNLAVTPSVQYLHNPALNPIDDAVTVLGLRARITF